MREERLDERKNVSIVHTKMNVMFVVNPTINRVSESCGFNATHARFGDTKNVHHILEMDHSFVIFAVDSFFKSKLC